MYSVLGLIKCSNNAEKKKDIELMINNKAAPKKENKIPPKLLPITFAMFIPSENCELALTRLTYGTSSVIIELVSSYKSS